MKDLPQQGDTVFLARTGEPLRVAERIGEGGQGVVHRAMLRTGAPLAIKWYRGATDTPNQRRAIATLAGNRTPHDAFLFPLDTLTGTDLTGFGYAMPWLDTRFVPFAKILNDPRPPGLQTKARIGRKLAEAFGALHASGLCYRDINFSNLYVDPRTGDVAIIDNDNVGLDDGHAAVWGVPRFMAPEVIRRERKPSTISDLHSLAVLLFYLCTHGHPLEGKRLAAEFEVPLAQRRTDEQLAMDAYGLHPQFVFDPHSEANRPVDGPGPAAWWPLYPDFLKRLFISAFTVGLTDATLGGRVLASTWRDALVQLGDLCHTCPDCAAALIFDPEHPEHPCWKCGRVPPPRTTLRLRGGRHTVLLVAGAQLASHHVTNDRDYDTPAALVEVHPRAGLVLRNRSRTPWVVTPAGDGPRPVAPGQAYALRPGSLNFGTVSGDVVTP
ncbi:MAG TPA: hypothetical protein VGJ28_19185 [Micromonosporaceae bacterium]